MYVEFDRFTAAVTRLAQMRSERLLRIVMSPHAPLALEIDQEAADVPEPGGGLYADIQDALGAVLSDVSADDFVVARSAPRPQFPQPEEASRSRAKYEALVRAFPIAELKQRARLRQTSGVHVLTALNWEVLVKRHDSFPAAEPSTAPRALVTITAERASESPFVPDREVSVFVADLDDIEYIQAKLEQLRDALVKMADDND